MPGWSASPSSSSWCRSATCTTWAPRTCPTLPSADPLSPHRKPRSHSMIPEAAERRETALDFRQKYPQPTIPTSYRPTTSCFRKNIYLRRQEVVSAYFLWDDPATGPHSAQGNLSFHSQVSLRNRISFPPSLRADASQHSRRPPDLLRG